NRTADAGESVDPLQISWRIAGSALLRATGLAADRESKPIAAAGSDVGVYMTFDSAFGIFNPDVLADIHVLRRPKRHLVVFLIDELNLMPDSASRPRGHAQHSNVCDALHGDFSCPAWL